MYKERYLKYKTKYLELKNQLGGGVNITYESNILIINDTINNITLSINYNEGKISIINTANEIYNIWIDSSHESFLQENNLFWLEMLKKLNDKNKIIYKNLFGIAINELKKNINHIKQMLIDKLNFYIKTLK